MKEKIANRTPEEIRIEQLIDWRHFEGLTLEEEVELLMLLQKEGKEKDV